MIFELALLNLKNNFFRTSLAILSLTISFTLITLSFGLNNSLNNLKSNLDQNLNLLEIKSQTTTLNFITDLVAKKNSNPLNDQLIETLKLIPGVINVTGERTLPNISSIQIKILNSWFQTDSLIYGVNHDFLNNPKITETMWEKTSEPYPVVISTQLLDLYNYSFAPSNNLPPLTESNLLNTEIIILPNTSTLFKTGSENTKSFRGKIIGFSPNVSLPGITLSNTALQIINQQLNREPITNFQKINLTLSSPDLLSSVQTSIQELGFAASPPSAAGRSFLNLISYINLFTIIFNLIFFTFSATTLLSIFTTNIKLRFHEFGILRSIGATRTQLFSLLQTESGLIGLTSSLIGIFIGQISIYFLNSIINLNIFQLLLPISLPQTLLILIFGFTFTTLCTLLPSISATKHPPLQVLNE